MWKLTVGFGVVLLALGIVGFVLTGSIHFTALIPAAFGVAFVILGGVARDEGKRKHAMHAAAALALLGFFGTVMGLRKLVTMLSGGDVERPAAVVSQSVMAVLCVIFVALCVRSFVNARRARSA